MSPEDLKDLPPPKTSVVPSTRTDYGLPVAPIQRLRLMSPSDWEEVVLEWASYRAIGDFSPEDRLILQLRFWHGRKVPEIARIMGLEPKKVYKRLDRLFTALRRALEDAGIDHAIVGELMDGPALDLSLELRPERTSGSNGDRR